MVFAGQLRTDIFQFKLDSASQCRSLLFQPSRSTSYSSSLVAKWPASNDRNDKALHVLTMTIPADPVGAFGRNVSLVHWGPASGRARIRCEVPIHCLSRHHNRGI
jgi:hypothetical protein